MSGDAGEAAQQVLIEHQRVDIGHCACGWGVDNGNLGQSHSQHVIFQLQMNGLDIVWR